MSENSLEYQKDYYNRNRDKITQKKRECRAARKEHYAEVAKVRYHLKREHILNLSKIRREYFPEKTLLTLAKRRAKVKDLPFDITVQDILIPSVCPLLGIPLKRSENKSSPNSPTLDRLYPERGYVKGNIWVISARANLIKNDATPEEFWLIAEKLKERINDQL